MWLLVATESGPQTRALTHVLEAHAAVGVQAFAHFGGRIDVRIVAHRLIHQRRRGLVGGGEKQRIGQLGDRVRPQHEFDERPRSFRVWRVLGDGQVVLPDQRAFLGNAVSDFERLVGLVRLIRRQARVTVVGQREADRAVGQIADLPTRGDVEHGRLQFLQQRFGGGQISFVGAVRIFAEVVQREADDFLR